MGIYDEVTPFLHAWGQLVTFDNTTSIFELEGTEGVRVRVQNATHLRLNLIGKGIIGRTWASGKGRFEILAPMTAVETVAGEIPPAYIEEHPLSYYVGLRNQFSGE